MFGAGGNARRVARAVCVLALIAPAHSGYRKAHAAEESEIQWSSQRPHSSRINPTGRSLNLAMPMSYKKHHLGEIAVRISPRDEISVPAEQFLRATERLLKPEAHQVIAALPSPNGYIALDQLRNAGLDIHYDPAIVALVLDLSVDQRARSTLSLGARHYVPDSANAVASANISAFVNMLFGVDYISQSEIDDGTGVKNPRLDLQAALNIMGWVLESEGTVESDDDFDRQNFKRRGSRLVKDWQANAMRLKLGDVDPVFSGFQRGTDVLGFTLEHNIRMLQPGRDIRATSRRSFRIERDSDVDIISNGQIVRRVRLAAGDYDMSDLPRTNGANMVTLIIRDDVGNENILEFTTFLDRSLLAPGITEWSASGGIKAFADDGEPDYASDDFTGSAYYRAGVTERLSAEVNLQGDKNVIMGGGGLLYGTEIGLFNVEAALSDIDKFGVGYGVNIDYHMAKNLLDWDGIYRNFNLSGEYRSDNFAAVNENNPRNDVWLILSASYGQQIWWDSNMAISTSYGFGRGTEGDYYRQTLSLSRTLSPYVYGSISASYTHDEDFVDADGRNSDDEFSASFRLTWRRGENSRITAAHDTYDNRSSVNYYSHAGKGVGAWSTNLRLEHDGGGRFNDSDEMQGGGAFRYTANRAYISATHSARFSGLRTDTTENRSTFRIETALACAGGMCGFGRPIYGPFALIRPHENIADKTVLINPTGDDVLAYADMFGPALVSNISTYSNSRLTFDVDDLPIGYDLGTGAFDLVAPYKAGYGLTVGSQYTVTAYGSMLDRYGEPVSLLTGNAWAESNPDRRVAIFTNRVGRFGAQGLAPGVWHLEMDTEPRSRYRIIVPEDAVGLVKTGTLRPVM